MSVLAAIAKRTLALDISSADHTFDAGDPCDALYIGTGGVVTLVDCAGTETPFANIPDAAELDVGATVIKSLANGTTASDIVALWF